MVRGISREKSNIVLIGNGCNIENCAFTVVRNVTSNVQTLSCKHGDVSLRHQAGVEVLSLLLAEALLSHTTGFRAFVADSLCPEFTRFLSRWLTLFTK